MSDQDLLNGRRQRAADWLQFHPDVRETLSIDPDRYSPVTSKSRFTSFRYALAGWLFMLKYGKNTRIHIVFSVLVLAVGWWLGLTPLEWSIIILTILINWVTEFVNGAIEAAINLASPQIHPMARVGKDVAAGASLVAAVASAIIGGLIMLPPLLERVLPTLLRLFVR
jgi:diacylglycerol kinase